MDQNTTPEGIPENIHELGVSQDYFDKIRGLYITANENDFMAFFRILQAQSIIVKFDI